MNDSDIEFTVGLDISPAEKKLIEIEKKLSVNKNVPNPSSPRYVVQQRPLWTMYESQARFRNVTPPRFYSPAMARFNSTYSDAEYKIKSGNPPPPIKPPVNKGGTGGFEEDRNEETEESITDELKRQGKEITNNTQGFLKTLAILFSIKKIIDAIVGAWKGFGKISGDVYGHITQQRGNFTSDPTGTLRVHTDLLYPRLIEGAIAYQKAGGKLITKENLDSMNSKMANAFAQAMAGEGVSTQGSIAAQRLHDVIGSQLTAEMLLTGQTGGLSNTELSVDLINKFEDFMTSGKWAKLSKPEQGQLLSSIKELLGEDVVNAIVQNVLNNQAIKDPIARKSLIERLLGAGGAAVEFSNITENTQKAIDSLAGLNSALTTLKNTIVDNFSPAFQKITSVLTTGIKFISSVVDKDRKAVLEATGMPESWQLLASLRDENVVKEYYRKATGEKDKQDIDTANAKATAAKLFNKALKNNDISALLDAYLFSLSGTSMYGGELFEAPKQRKILEGFVDMLSDSNKRQQYIDTGNPFWKELADYADPKRQDRRDMLKTLLSQSRFDMVQDSGLVYLLLSGAKLTDSEKQRATLALAKSDVWKNMVLEYFREGKGFDFKSGFSPSMYMLGDSRFFLNAIEQQDYIQTFLDDVTKANEKIADMYISQWKDKNGDQKIQFDELKVKVQLVGESTPREMTFSEALNANTR